jgi:galactose mutarotase-like enzyme
MHSIKIGNSELEVDFAGGRIAKLVLAGTPILGTFKRLDGAHANSHLCAPNMANEGVEKYSLPSHGPSRNATWEMVDHYEPFVAIQYDMPEIGTYPTTLRMYQEFYLAEHEFNHDISITNIGDEEVPINLGLHYYWHSPKGWDDLMLNGVNVADLVRQDTYTPISTENNIQISGQPEIQLTVEGMEYAQLWTGRGSNGESKQYNKDFVCIEPLRGAGKDFFGSAISVVPPDRSFHASCTIGVK